MTIVLQAGGKRMSAEYVLNGGMNELEVMEFMVGNHHYGINVAKIQEIIAWHPVTPVPNINPCIEGIFMPRKQMISVIDLRRCLGFEPFQPGDKKGLFIITQFSKLTTAFHIDEIRGIHRVSWENIHVPDTSAEAGGADLATGVVRIEDHLTVVLDFERIVSSINPEAGVKVSDLDEYEAKDRSATPILLAEDSKMLSKLIQECLRRAGYTNLIVNENGQEAWDKLNEFAADGQEKVLKKVHCIITDIEMPKMDGHTLTKLVKGHNWMKKIPVIIFSSMINDVIYKQGEELGADAQLTKPEIGRLVSVVDEMVERHENEMREAGYV